MDKYKKFREAFRVILFPLIILQFLRTMFFPTPVDVFILFLFFVIYVSIMMNII
ncbi:hypothetical protein [Tepidibacillus fermentans]|uniref:Uncharacterized protein n=1 Tax=Tepidibacillus fermentans TaxID=1281767 RepID=A0A4R3KJS5_9BACI|nr:hypothetical protein [Tepidibacillus fermentans]TCS83458.1 hypothetical protein EDD72_1041 [Tepidibacillus fermentans]